MRIRLTSVFVDDQRAALAFYTERLGFVVKHDVPIGDDAWLTVVPADDPDGPELLLEPSATTPSSVPSGAFCLISPRTVPAAPSA